MPTSSAASSVHPVAAEAVGEVGGALLEAGQVDVDLLWVAVSPSLAGAAEDIVGALGQLTRAATSVAVVAEGVLVGDRMVLDGPAIAALGVSGVDCSALRLGPGQDPVPTDGRTGLCVLCFDPFSVATSDVLALPGGPLAGGSLSVGRAPGGNTMLLDGVVYRDGAVGVTVASSDASVIVSPAWHPVGAAVTVLEVRPSDGALLHTSRGAAAEHYAELRELAGEDAEASVRPVGALLLGDHAALDPVGDAEVVTLRVAHDGCPVPERRVQAGSTVQFALDSAELSGRDLGERLRSARDGRGVAGRSAIALIDRCRPGAVHPGILGDASVLGESGPRSVCGMLCGSQVVRDDAGRAGTRGSTAVAVL